MSVELSSGTFRTFMVEGKGLQTPGTYDVAFGRFNHHGDRHLQAFYKYDPPVAVPVGVLRLVVDTLIGSDAAMHAMKLEASVPALNTQVSSAEEIISRLQELLPSIAAAVHVVTTHSNINCRKMADVSGEALQYLLVASGTSLSQVDTGLTTQLILNAQQGELISPHFEMSVWSQSPYGGLIRMLSSPSHSDYRGLAWRVALTKFLTRLPAFAQLLPSSTVPDGDTTRRGTVLSTIYGALLSVANAPLFLEAAAHKAILDLPFVKQWVEVSGHSDLENHIRRVINNLEGCDVFGLSKLLTPVREVSLNGRRVFHIDPSVSSILQEIESAFTGSVPSETLDTFTNPAPDPLPDDDWSPIDRQWRPPTPKKLDDLAQLLFQRVKNAVEQAEVSFFQADVLQTPSVMAERFETAKAMFAPSTIAPAGFPDFADIAITTGATSTSSPGTVLAFEDATHVPAWTSDFSVSSTAKFKKRNVRRILDEAREALPVVAAFHGGPWGRDAGQAGLPFGLNDSMDVSFIPSPYVGGTVGVPINSTDPQMLAAQFRMPFEVFSRMLTGMTTKGGGAQSLRGLATLFSGFGYLFVTSDGAKGLNRISAPVRSSASEAVDGDETKVGDFTAVHPYPSFIFGVEWRSLLRQSISEIKDIVSSAPPLGKLDTSEGYRSMRISPDLLLVPYPWVPRLDGPEKYYLTPDGWSHQYPCTSLVHVEYGAVGKDDTKIPKEAVSRFYAMPGACKHLNWWPIPIGKESVQCVFNIADDYAFHTLIGCSAHEALATQSSSQVSDKGVELALLSRVATVDVAAAKRTWRTDLVTASVVTIQKAAPTG